MERKRKVTWEGKAAGVTQLHFIFSLITDVSGQGGTGEALDRRADPPVTEDQLSTVKLRLGCGRVDGREKRA